MKYCIKCGTQITDAADFCPKCGAQQETLETAAIESSGTASFELPHKRKCKRWLPAVGVVLAIIAAIAIWSILKPVLSTEKNKFSDSPESISSAAESVVKLSCYNKAGDLYCTGSAFAFFEANTFVTNYHVLSDDVYSIIAETEAGMSFPVTSVIAYEEEKDIAIIKTDVETGIPVLPLGNSDSLEKGDKVIAIGSPLGLKNTVSSGIFSNLIEEDGNDYLEFSASISDGSSGGALFNNKGEVIGITSASYIDSQNLNLAVPINQVSDIWNSKTEELGIEDFYLIFEHTQTYTVSYLLENAENHLNENFYIIGYLYRKGSSASIVNSEKALNEIMAYEKEFSSTSFDEWIMSENMRSQYMVNVSFELLMPDELPEEYVTGDMIKAKGHLYCYDSSSSLNPNKIKTNADDIEYYSQNDFYQNNSSSQQNTYSVLDVHVNRDSFLSEEIDVRGYLYVTCYNDEPVALLMTVKQFVERMQNAENEGCPWEDRYFRLKELENHSVSLSLKLDDQTQFPEYYQNGDYLTVKGTLYSSNVLVINSKNDIKYCKD